MLSRWQHTFTVPLYWVSDQGAHFINDVMKTMSEAFNIQHHPTVADSPWVNGTVERLNRDILCVVRAMLGELKLAPQDWVSIIDNLPSVLNEAPEARLGRNKDGTTRTALEVMTGKRPRRAIIQVMSQHEVRNTPCTLERASSERLCSITDIQESLSELHKDVKKRIDTRHHRAI